MFKSRPRAKDIDYLSGQLLLDNVHSCSRLCNFAVFYAVVRLHLHQESALGLQGFGGVTEKTFSFLNLLLSDYQC